MVKFNPEGISISKLSLSVSIRIESGSITGDTRMSSTLNCVNVGAVNKLRK